MRPINDILAKVNVPDESTAFSPMGRHIAKINLEYLDKLKNKPESVENVHLLSSNPVDLVVEAASQDAVSDNALSILQNRKDLVIMSSGALLDESVFEIISEGDEVSEITKAKSILDISLAAESSPEDNEIKWYKAIINEAVQNNALADEIYSKLNESSSITLNQLLRVNEVQRRLNSGIENRMRVLYLAIKSSDSTLNQNIQKSLF